VAANNGFAGAAPSHFRVASNKKSPKRYSLGIWQNGAKSFPVIAALCAGFPACYNNRESNLFRSQVYPSFYKQVIHDVTQVLLQISSNQDELRSVVGQLHDGCDASSSR
jgi:hypothetical protein